MFDDSLAAKTSRLAQLAKMRQGNLRGGSGVGEAGGQNNPAPKIDPWPSAGKHVALADKSAAEQEPEAFEDMLERMENRPIDSEIKLKPTLEDIVSDDPDAEGEGLPADTPTEAADQQLTDATDYADTAAEPSFADESNFEPNEPQQDWLANADEHHEAVDHGTDDFHGMDEQFSQPAASNPAVVNNDPPAPANPTDEESYTIKLSGSRARALLAASQEIGADPNEVVVAAIDWYLDALSDDMSSD